MAHGTSPHAWDALPHTLCLACRACAGCAGIGSHTLGTSAPIAKFQHPSHALLENHGFKQIVYKKYHKRCLEERAQKGERGVQGLCGCDAATAAAGAVVWAGVLGTVLHGAKRERSSTTRLAVAVV